MPNIVQNILRVTGPLDVVADFLDVNVAQAGGYRIAPWSRNMQPERYSDGQTHEPRETRLFTFAGLVPIPQSVLDAGYSDAGHDWQRENWGVKWDAGKPEVVQVSNGAIITFTTAWSSPLAWLRVAVGRFQVLHFELFARDEYPWTLSVDAYTYDGDAEWEQVYGETIQTDSEVDA